MERPKDKGEKTRLEEEEEGGGGCALNRDTSITCDTICDSNSCTAVVPYVGRSSTQLQLSWEADSSWSVSILCCTTHELPYSMFLVHVCIQESAYVKSIA